MVALPACGFGELVCAARPGLSRSVTGSRWVRWALCYRGVWPELDGIAGSPAAPAADPCCPAALLPRCPAALLPCCPTGRRSAYQCRSCRGTACREQQLTNPSATPTCPAVLAAQPAARPPARPPPGLSVSILQRCCLPRTAAHQSQHHPNPTRRDTTEKSGQQPRPPPTQRTPRPETGNPAHHPETHPPTGKHRHHARHPARRNRATRRNLLTDTHHTTGQTQTPATTAPPNPEQVKTSNPKVL